MEKIWNPFFTTKSQGTGLGLGIVKNIIESHRGNIDIRNRSSIGAQVIIHLPHIHFQYRNRNKIVCTKTGIPS